MPAYCPILATLGYVMSADGKSVLMVHRNKRPDDVHYGKYNGLGGKIEAQEDVVSGMKREIKEESGIDVEQICLRGTVSWPGFGKNGEDWFGFLFRIDSFSGEVHQGNHEGTLEWVPIDRLSEINMWESDKEWLDMVFDNETSTFHAVAPFHQGKMISWKCVRI